MISRISVFLFLAVCFLVCSPPVFPDQITLNDGTKEFGRIVGYLEDNLSVISNEGALLKYSLSDIASFVVDATKETPVPVPPLSLDEVLYQISLLHEGIAYLTSRIDQLQMSVQQSSQTLNSEIYKLNPMSNVVITESKGGFRGGAYVIEGKVRNDSSIFITGVKVRATLLNDQGRPVTQVTAPVSPSVVTPEGQGSFFIRISSPPQFARFTLSLTRTSTPTDETQRGVRSR